MTNRRHAEQPAQNIATIIPTTPEHSTSYQQRWEN